MSATTPPGSVTELLGEHGFPFRLELVPVDHVHANPWNPNRMDDRTRGAARESIATYGFIDPITVREHPDLDGHFQMIDGEHRWIEAKELGLHQLPAVVLDVDDVAAKKLTIIFNETRGEADAVMLGTLLSDLQKTLGDDLRIGLRYDSGELQHLLALAEQDWGDYDPAGEAPPAGDGEDGEWETITLRVPAGVVEVFDQARELATAEAFDAGVLDGKPDAVRDGLIFEVILADYLAGDHGRAEPDADAAEQ